MSESNGYKRTYIKQTKFDVNKNKKHTVMKYLLLFLFLISNNMVVICGVPDSQIARQPKIVPSIDNKNINNGSIDYKILYENQKDFSNDILVTVYWALSSILLIILVIIGSNLFFNYKFNKEQYVELENELTQSINLLKSNLAQKIKDDIANIIKVSDEKIEKYKSDTQKEHGEKIKELTNNYQERLDSFSDNLKEQIITLKERLEIIQKENSANIGNLESSISKYNENMNELIDKRSKEIIIDIEGLEAEIWKSKKVYNNALRRYVSQSIKAIELNWIWKLKYTLNDLIEMLKKVTLLYEVDLESLEQLFPKIPDSYSNEIAKIKTLVNQLPKEKITTVDNGL